MSMFIDSFLFSAPAAPLVTQTADTYIARMTVAPSSSVQTAIHTFFTDAAAIIAKLDLLYLVGNDQQQSLLNVVNPTYDGIAHGSIDFIPYAGFGGNLIDFYIGTGFLPSATSYYQLHNCCAGGVVQDTMGADNHARSIIGYIGPTSITFLQLNSTSVNQCKARMNSTTSKTFTQNPVNVGHYLMSTITSTGFAIYRNGTVIDSSGSENGTISDWSGGEVCLHTTGSSSGPATPGKYRGSAHYLGASLSASEVVTFYNALHAYLSAVGAE
jgi:hypothetical protein